MINVTLASPVASCCSTPNAPDERSDNMDGVLLSSDEVMKKPLQTPEEIRLQIWKELGRASQDRHHEWRTPVLATASSSGAVNARTVVLRAANMSTETLTIYTDKRSPKVTDLMQQPSALFVFWSTRLSWQLRVRVTMSVQTSGPLLESLWQVVRQSPSASDYLDPAPPGAKLPLDIATNSDDNSVHHFSVITAQVTEIDWLELARTGHRRAQIGTDSWAWLTP